MTRREVWALRDTVSGSIKLEVSRNNRGWAFQMQDVTDVWWDTQVTERSGYGKSYAEAYLLELSKHVEAHD